MPIIPSDGALDPNLFALNWNTVFEVLIAIIILAFVLERALALLFESVWFLKFEKRRTQAGRGSFQPLIAFLVAAAVCVLWQFDALSIILLREKVTLLGELITGAVVAGGSKASIKLFRDVLDVKSGAYRAAKESAVAEPAAELGKKKG